MDLNVAMLEADTSMSPEPVLEISQQPQSRGSQDQIEWVGQGPPVWQGEQPLCHRSKQDAKEVNTRRLFVGGTGGEQGVWSLCLCQAWV